MQADDALCISIVQAMIPNMSRATKHPARPRRAEDELFPIRTVSNLTGVNAITLRAWERRYGVVTPVRTDGGQRLYRREEIELIQRKPT